MAVYEKVRYTLITYDTFIAYFCCATVAHGLCDTALQKVYRAVVVARLLYAASAWWGFTTAADR